MSPDKDSSNKTVQCPDCSGRGTIAFATEDVTCATCDGKGTVKASESR